MFFQRFALPTAIVATLIGLPNASAATEPCDHPLFSIVAIPAPSAIDMVVDDFNNDGLMDVAVMSNSKVVTVALQNERGVFAISETLPFPVGVKNYLIHSGDIDSDGDIDLLVADWLGAANFTLNDGTGHFSNVWQFSGHLWLRDIIYHDFSGDGTTDSIVSSELEGFYSLVDGQYSYYQGFTVNPMFLEPLDINGDGAIDIAVADFYEDTVSAFLNNGSGTFAVTSTVSTLNGPFKTAAGDFDGDGCSDLAVLCSGSTYITLLRCNTMNQLVPWNIFSIDIRSVDITAFDYDQDGDDDLLLASDFIEPGLRLFRNDRDLGFVHVPFMERSDTQRVIGRDLDADGDADAVILTNDGAFVVRNIGQGYFDLDESHVVPAPPPYLLTLVDLDGDRDLDYVHFDDNGNFFVTRLNEGGGQPGETEIYKLPQMIAEVVAHDLDDDGDVDLAVHDYDRFVWRNGITIFRNDGFGRFTQAGRYEGRFYNSGLSTGDMNQDGRVDLVITGERGFYTLSNGGNLTFRLGPLVRHGSPVETTHLADMNNDGKLDVVQTSRLNTLNVVVVAFNSGPFGFVFSKTPTVPGSVNERAFEVDDLDRDGDIDVVVATQRHVDVQVEILLNNGAGVLSLGSSTSFISLLYNKIALADMNCDGFPDLINPLKGAAVGLNRGDATFGPVVSYATTFEFGLGELGDMDGDGDLDIVIADGSKNQLTIMKNRCVQD